jgi:hypothetical protein
MINEFDRCPMRLIFRAAVGELFVTPQQRDERGRDPLPPPSPRRSGLAHARGREPMQPADAYRHNLCAIGPGRVLVNPDFIDVERLPPILKHWDVLIGPDRIRWTTWWRSSGCAARGQHQRVDAGPSARRCGSLPTLQRALIDSVSSPCRCRSLLKGRLAARSTAPHWTQGVAGTRELFLGLDTHRGSASRDELRNSGDPTYRRSATSAGSSLTVARGNSPPRGVKTTEHSTVMGVF